MTPIEWMTTERGQPTAQVPAGQTVVIEATATDHPGHTGTKRVDHACGPR